MTGGPLVIGGTGGSGTRLFARIAQAAGVYLGADLNESEDQVELAAFYDRWINRWLVDPDASEAPMKKELEPILRRHRSGLTESWGWKEPRSIFLVDFFARAFSGFQLLHVIRDGRDMAYSTNQNQLRKHGDAVLGLPGALEPERSIALWAAVNDKAADLGESEIEQHYLQVRFENLLTDPEGTVSRILGFLGSPADPVPIAAHLELVSPPSAGAWRSQPAEDIAALEKIAATTLSRFGYKDAR